MKKIIALSCMGLGFICTFIGIALEDNFSVFLTWAIFAIVFLLAGLGFIIAYIVGESAKNKIMKKLLRYDYKSKTLVLLGRGQELKGIVCYRSVHNYSLGVTPKELHYGSVSVGNVTTGGFYTTGGNRNVIDLGDSGKCEIVVVVGRDRLIVNRIALTDELFKQASESPISCYLDKNEKCILVEVMPELSEYEVKRELRNSNILVSMTPGTQVDTSIISKSKPTQAKANAIVNWVIGA